MLRICYSRFAFVCVLFLKFDSHFVFSYLTVSFCDIPGIKVVNIVGNQVNYIVVLQISFFQSFFAAEKSECVGGNACTEEHVKVAMVARAQMLFLISSLQS